jgi:hypothetical protein
LEWHATAGSRAHGFAEPRKEHPPVLLALSMLDFSWRLRQPVNALL